ncbi:MAG TPA: hypothetical protein VGF67_00030 [Ktedonobacteraceae bacterium]
MSTAPGLCAALSEPQAVKRGPQSCARNRWLPALLQRDSYAIGDCLRAVCQHIAWCMEAVARADDYRQRATRAAAARVV